MGGAHIACENISNVAAKLLEDARIGIAPLEKSTRYVRFDQKDAAGNYLFYREPKIMASRHGAQYLARDESAVRDLFKADGADVGIVAARCPSSRSTSEIRTAARLLSYSEASKDERLKRWAETAYRATVRAQACDVLRSYLPAATLTNVGMFGVGQAFEYLLSKFYSHHLSEVKDLAAAMHSDLNQLIPSFVKRAQRTTISPASAAAAMARSTRSTPLDGGAGYVDRLRCRGGRKNHRRHSLSSRAPRAGAVARPAALSHENGERFSPSISTGGATAETSSAARSKTSITPSTSSVTSASIAISSAIAFSPRSARTSPRYTATTRREKSTRGVSSEFDHCMEQAAELYEQIYRDLPSEAQYVVPFAYKIRWYMKMNLREALHMIELRTLPQGHPDYRFIGQEMWRKIQEAHPALAECGKFIDWGSYRLGGCSRRCARSLRSR